MRKVEAEVLKNKVSDLFVQANYVIGSDIMEKLKDAFKKEDSVIGGYILEQLIENYRLAKEEQIAVCQDTGFAVVFVELGQEVVIAGGDFNEAINQGVRAAYKRGFLRKSVVREPLFERKNTQDNTPAVTHIEIVPGDKIKIIVSPKGFGSENMSAVKMLKPAEGIERVIDFVVETVIKAGPNSCPPVIVGVGIGGTLEKAALLAKKATIRPLGQSSADNRYRELEEIILKEINRSGLGPGGLGGRTTALAVNVEYYPTHIAGLPVAVNICCHAARHAEGVI